MSTKKRGAKRKAEAVGPKAGGPKAKKAKEEAVGPKAKKGKEESILVDDRTWKNTGDIVKGVSPLIVLASTSLPGRERVAGFDIDFTVVRTASGKTFAAGNNLAGTCKNDVLKSMRRHHVAPTSI